ncbi:carbohydrate porin [Beijerinckiaceae bacterium]|nr:carbohydrate porin [Beijerinckiaceae bacterium]
MKLNVSICALLTALWFALSGGSVRAQDVLANSPAPESEALPPNLQPSIASSIPVLARFKKALLDLGYNLQLNYTGEVLGNPTGGIRQGTINEGLFEMALDGDLNKIAGLTGASFHINAYVIHGRGLSTYNLFDISTISSIEARPTTRLFEAWVEQQFFDGLAAVRVGQLSADTDFFISEFDALFINGTFGWPDLMRADLPSNGGPTYPLATPGVRLKLIPNDQTTFLAALYNGDPSGAGFSGLGEILDPAGINFRLRDPPLLIGEAQFKYNQSADSPGLPGTIKLGAWHHFGGFNDQRLAADGGLLADPSKIGNPFIHSGDTGVYGVIDQMVWRRSRNEAKKGIAVFARAAAAPSDRNLIDFYADAGIDLIGIFDTRPDDSFGAAVSYSRISPDTRQQAIDQALFTPGPYARLDDEVSFEATYQAQIIPGFLVQPDFQYVFHPGGGMLNPLNRLAGRIPDAAVFGVRSTIKF